MVSDANDLGVGERYGIRLAMNGDCGAQGTYYDFAGGVGSAFVAPWEVPTVAPDGAYVACLTLAGSPVEFTHVPFVVSR